MRHRILLAALAAAWPLALVAQAQDSEETSQPQPAEGAAHDVVPGDTLWDISERYLGTPWEWPRVWSYNPEIENPHWIFPDDRVRLGPERIPMATEELPIVYEEPVEVPDVAVVGTIGYQGGPRRQVRTTGIITPAALQESGTITKSWEEKALLSHGDRIYLDWPKDRQAQAGQSYVVFRTERKIHHPTTGAFMGHFTKILGTVKIVDASPWRDHVTAVIESSVEEIERGDRIGPSVGDFQGTTQVASTANTKNLVGRIAATQERGVGELGQDHLVFLDRGAAHGVREGNTFLAVRAQDGLELEEPSHLVGVSNLPAEELGTLLVVSVQEQTAAAVVVRSVRELRVGDRVVMRASAR